MEKDKALEMAVLQIERQYGKGSIMRLGDDVTREGARHLYRLAGARSGPWGRWDPAWPGGRGVRSRVERKDHAGSPHDRGGAKSGWQGGVHRRRARHGLALRPEDRRQHRRTARVSARQRRAGSRDHRTAHPQRRPRHRRHRLGGRIDAQGRDRGRDGRFTCGPAGPTDEPGPPQADGHHQQDADDRRLHQPVAREGRRHVRQPGSHPGWPGPEVLRVGPARHPPHRDSQRGHRGCRQPGARTGGQEQGRPAVQRGGVRHHVRSWHLQRGRRPRSGGRRTRSSRRAAPGSRTAISGWARAGRTCGSCCATTPN